MRIYVIGEEDRRQNMQLIGKARELARRDEDEISLIFIAGRNMEDEHISEYMRDYPVEQIILWNVDERKFRQDRSHICIDVLEEFLVETRAELILFPSTFMWREVAAALSVILDGALLTDCIELKREEERLIGVRPSLDGKSLSFYQFSGGYPYFSVMKVGSVKEEGEMPYCHEVRVRSKELGEDTTANPIYIETISKQEERIRLEDAQMIVAGGRGMLNQDSFLELRELAKVYHASVGASRPVVDQGWARVEEQVGQTGSFVKPKVYLAFGISGAVQHLAGMKDSQVIIAVNQNQDSPIFRYCDYGIIADANSIIRNMLQILGRKKSMLEN